MTTSTAAPRPLLDVLEEHVARVRAERERAGRLRKTLRAAVAVFGEGPVDHHVTIAGRPVHLKNRGADAHMGRHGGGWETEVGVQLGRRGLAGTVLVNLGRGSVRIDPRPTSRK